MWKLPFEWWKIMHKDFSNGQIEIGIGIAFWNDSLSSYLIMRLQNGKKIAWSLDSFYGHQTAYDTHTRSMTMANHMSHGISWYLLHLTGLRKMVCTWLGFVFCCFLYLRLLCSLFFLSLEWISVVWSVKCIVFFIESTSLKIANFVRRILFRERWEFCSKRFHADKRFKDRNGFESFQLQNMHRIASVLKAILCTWAALISQSDRLIRWNIVNFYAFWLPMVFFFILHSSS